MENHDKMGEKAWEDKWQAQEELPPPFDPCGRGPVYYLDRRFHRFFTEAFAGQRTSSMRLIEVGCARSRFLPYFVRAFGFAVTGVDYSPTGCRMAEQVLARERVNGVILESDLFTPPDELLERFDVLVSFGLVEHFTDTAGCVKALARFLRPGGLMITNIPNLLGAVGGFQLMVDDEIFRTHVLLSPEDLKIAHEAAGLNVVSCRYFLAAHFGVVNTDSLTQGRPASRLLAVAAKAVLSLPVWILEPIVPWIRPNRLTSPYIHCLAKKP